MRIPKNAFVTIHCPSSGMGLKKDALIIQNALNANSIANQIVYIHFGITHKTAFHKLFYKIKEKLSVVTDKIKLLLGFKKHHLSIHLEVVMHRHLFRSPTNILIPNQEWCQINPLMLEKIDLVWCKSRLSEHIFSELGFPVRFIGFQTSIKRLPNLDIERKAEFFTRIGMTKTRGSDQLVDIWSQHPEWPRLNMVVDHSLKPNLSPANVHYVSPIESDDDYFRLVNSFQFHIYVTEAEGFGHSILESMSTGAIVLVTQAAPMTEYANSDSVVMIKAEYAGQMRLSPRFKSSNAQIENAVETALGMKEEDISRMKEHALLVNKKLEAAFIQSIQIAVEYSLGSQ